MNKEEKAQRQHWAVAQIDKGVGFSELTSLTAHTWGVTRRQARTVVKGTHKEWLDAFNDEDINQRDLLFQCLGRLERTARKAEESGNFACVIGAVQLMNRMMALGADQAGFRGHRHNGHYYPALTVSTSLVATASRWTSNEPLRIRPLFPELKPLGVKPVLTRSLLGPINKTYELQ